MQSRRERGPADVRRGQGIRADLLADVPEGRDREVSRGPEAHRSALPRAARAQPASGRAGEVRRLRALRLGLPGRRDLRRGRGQHRGGALLARRAVRRRLPDQLPALHLLRAVHRGLPHPLADDEQRLRAGRRQPAGPDLHQGAAHGAAAAGHGAAAAPDAAGRRREGLLPAGAGLVGGRAGAGGAGMTETLGGGGTIVFWVLGPIALAGALGMVLSRNAIHSALWLVNTMLALGVFYVVQEAPFLGAVQIIVYTGAIMILFLFVLMLVGRDSSDSVVETLRGQRIAATVLGVGFAALVGAGIARATQDMPVTGLEGVQGEAGNIPAIAELLFTDYLLAFEVTSALLITAAVGAMVLAHIEREPGTRRTQKELSKARFLGERPSTMPGPGVYARGNSVAAPALLPDGGTADDSVGTGLEPQQVEEMPRPTGRRELGEPDAALGSLEPTVSDIPGGRMGGDHR